MTTGEYLLSKSPLSSGSALQHLLAMQAGGETGRTVFCSQFNTTVERSETFVVRKAKHSPPPVVEPTFHETTPADRQQNTVFCHRGSVSVWSFSTADEVCVLRRRFTTNTFTRLNAIHVTEK